MRPLAILSLVLSLNLAPVLVGTPSTAQAQASSACYSQSPGGDARTFTCPLSVPDGTRHFRFTAAFSGGHDDTMASMTLTLDGAPLACAPGSKTSLMGEDGDVGLECKFSIAGNAGAAQ